MTEFADGLQTVNPKPGMAPVLHDVAAVVLAGSYHWSGGTFDEILPRPLLPVGGKPIIEHVLSWMSEGGVPTAILCANGSTAALRRHLQSLGDARIGLLYHEDGTPRGAAGCLKDAAKLTTANTLVVSDGASLPVAPLQEMVRQHLASGAALTIGVRRTTTEGTAVDSPVGVYVFSREVLEKVPSTSFQDIKEAFIPRLHRDGHRIGLFSVGERSPRVFDPSSYLAANRWYLERCADVVAAPNAWVDPDAVLSGPVMLGAGARILAGAVVIGPTVIGAGTVVGQGAVVARSVTWQNVQIGERAFVDSSIVTSNASVGAETVVTGLVRTPARRERNPFARARLWLRKDAAPGIIPTPAVS